MLSVLVSLSLIALVCGQIPSSMPVTHYAILTPDQPTAPTDSSAMGAAIFNLNAQTGALTYEVIHTVDSPVAAHIHGAAFPGNDAGIVVTFASPASNTYLGTASLTASQVTGFNAGMFYVNIHTTEYANGEIRGQILSGGQSVVSLLGSYDIPVTDSDASGHAFLTFSTTSNKLSWNITHNVANVTAMHFHGPANDSNTAGIEIPIALTPALSASPVVGSATATSTEPADFTSGYNYINIHSTTYPNGEIRGQTYYSNVLYAIPLNGASDGVTTTNIGIAIISASTDKAYLDVFVISTIDDPTGCHIHAPAAVGVTANPLVILSDAQVSVNHYMPITPTINGYIASGMAYVNVHSTTYTNGELRGQVVPLGTVASGSSTTGGATNGGSTGSTTAATGGSSMIEISIFLVASLLAVLLL